MYLDMSKMMTEDEIVASGILKLSEEEPLYTTNFTEPLSYQGSAFLKLPKFP